MSVKTSYKPGTFCWIDLGTPDQDDAGEFYGALFGWSFEEKEFEGAGTYTSISLGEETVGGLSNITDRVPAEVPAHWLVYFAVEDADATLARANQRGGEVFVGPMDIAEVGRLAVLKDPWGAIFAVIQPDPQMQPQAG